MASSLKNRKFRAENCCGWLFAAHRSSTHKGVAGLPFMCFPMPASYR
ncbi:MAG TPA: hypothetical protein DEB17_06575 [Chlorobaculum sp.]|uniref:Uncharacterized protein n=1 Tax=Chlorobaculum tepidum (strain ATCC 49652 / DSM 12025 / NBRC 103806 / TLS) TaxID=194439 RepID=Q8KG05_CHLTE|nr:hypothetical protein CT0165 [Chlorobaculum tepidum TLS]HBU23640.1 hypothetical protein [Chlorobaculum sp.]